MLQGCATFQNCNQILGESDCDVENQQQKFSMRVFQSLLLLVPCAYFSFDRAEGCNYMCCPNEDIMEMVPGYFADYSLLCMTTAIPLVVFA